MKQVLILLLLVFLLAQCKKEKYGNVRQQIKCTTAQQTQHAKSMKSNQSLRYTQFGDFITTITPTSFIGEMEVVRYYAMNESGSFMTLIQREPNQGEEVVMADFSSNATLSVIPVLNGTNIIENPDGQGGFFADKVTFKVAWIRMGLKQVIELPDAYKNVTLNQFQGAYSEYSDKNLTVLTTDIIPLLHAVEDLKAFGNRITIYFGMTDKTYIEYNEQFLGNATRPSIRCSMYDEWTLDPPMVDETKIIVSTIGFNNTDIIQVYAGADNIPYTTDDIVVLEPNFWERFYMKVTQN